MNIFELDLGNGMKTGRIGNKSFFSMDLGSMTVGHIGNDHFSVMDLGNGFKTGHIGNQSFSKMELGFDNHRKHR